VELFEGVVESGRSQTAQDNTFEDDDPITAGFKNLSLSTIVNPNPFSFAKDMYGGMERVRQREEFRKQVENLGETVTGPEFFPASYKQEKTNMNTNDQGFFANLATGITNTFGGISDFITGVAKPINTIATTFGSDTNIIGGNAVPTTRNTGGMETRNSGTITGSEMISNIPTQQAFLGGLGALRPAINTASRFLRSPTGQVATGAGGTALGFLGSNVGGSTQPRITRRMRSEIRRLLMMTGGNFDLVANIMNSSGKYPRINFNAQVIMMILIKRFRNDGAFVTKAAVRKTRSTIRKLKSMRSLLNEVTGSRVTRRRVSSSSTPRVTQIKN
jgi:hypothetical protein